MAERNYWIDLFTWNTWQQFLQVGGSVAGFRAGSKKLVQQIVPGDYLVAYIVRLARWVALLEATSEPYEDHTSRWKEDVFPWRVKVKLAAQLTAETGIPLWDLESELSIFKTSSERRSVGNFLRRSPTKLSQADGKRLAAAIQEAEKNPLVRPVDPAKLAWTPKLLQTKAIGAVTIPEEVEPAHEAEPSTKTPDLQPTEPQEATAHTEIQWELLKLGSDMKLDVWVAKNDRSKTYKGHAFADVQRLRDKLPVQFDEATSKTIELIDVLWLKGHQITAAFEIESTTSIYSGILRMADLIAMQPNLNIPLYLVAPDERRAKVFSEVNRPTFSRLTPPLNEVCRFIPFSTIRDGLSKLEPGVIRHLNADYIQDEVSESCLPDEA